MKTFKDLEFKSHPAMDCGFDTQARIDFENGYGISVVTGSAAYQSEGTYECAVMMNGEVCYDTEITNDVLSYQTPSQITAVMRKIQELPSK